jgi:hypothetical protein
MDVMRDIPVTYNYKQIGNDIAGEILNNLIKPDGTCEMFETFKKDFELTEDEKNQAELF